MRKLKLFLLLFFVQLAVPLAVLRAIWDTIVSGEETHTWEILKAYDRLANATFNGDSNETISSHANRARSENRKWGCVLCKWLDSIQANHCKDAEGV